MTGRPVRGVTARAPGKVNLSLTVGRRRADGYHPLSTVFQAVSVFEEVTASPAPTLQVSVSGAQAELVPTGPENLAARAAVLLAERVGIEPDVHLHLHKGVPVAGGMAGGSADAAAALVACDALWGTGLSRAELAGLAARLGADVPFALHGRTALGGGRGDELTPALTRGRYHWAFAVRDAGLSTPAVFARFDADAGDDVPHDPAPDAAVLAALRAADPVALGLALANDLEPAALALAPELAATLEVAQRAGALGVVVSGSGPTVAALALDRPHALAIAAAMGASGAADSVLCASGPVAGAQVVP